MSPPFQKPSQKAPERSRTYLLAGALVLQLVSPQSLPATGAVSICDEAHLRSAMVGGGTVTFACDGMISLADTLKVTNDTILDASGYSVILSGNNLVRVFTVPAGVSLTLSNLTVANGRDTGTNGNPGIDGGPGLGGGAWVAGTLNSTGCRFWSNVGAGGMREP